MKKEIIKRIKNGEKFKVRCIKDFEDIFSKSYCKFPLIFKKGKIYEVKRLDFDRSNIMVDGVTWNLSSELISNYCRFSGFTKK